MKKLIPAIMLLALWLSSCAVKDGRLDFTWWQDAAAPIVEDDVIIESGGGGYYMQGSVSELEKDNLLIGQEVTVNDWNTGMTYTGRVDSLGDYPSADGYWNGMGNPTASFCSFNVFNCSDKESKLSHSFNASSGRTTLFPFPSL
mgnify:CR=1 FL=1